MPPRAVQFAGLPFAAVLCLGLAYACKTANASRLKGEDLTARSARKNIADRPAIDTSLERTPPSALVDGNDVSVLFSYDLSSDTIKPDLPISTFLSQGLFDQVIAASTKVGIVHEADQGSGVYANWKVVAFRFDPCAPSADFAHEGVPSEFKEVVPGCLVQVRLIAQPLAVSGPSINDNVSVPMRPGKKTPKDFALHLVYTLGTYASSADPLELKVNFAPYQPVLDDLLTIKAAAKNLGADTNGARLGVHPGLKAERTKDTAEVSTAIQGFLTKYLKADGMGLIAMMGVPGRAFTPWIFFRGDVAKDQAGNAIFTTKALTDFGDAAKMSTQAPPQQVFTSYVDLPERKLSTAQIFRDKFNVSAAERFESVYAILHPTRTHALNMDCVSCHSTDIMVMGSTGGFASITDKKDLPADRYQVPRGITGYATAEASLGKIWNVHNFGYFVDSPTVSMRALNETSAVAALTNRIMAGGDIVGPGLDCGTDQAVLDEIYLCQVSAPYRFRNYPDADASRDACFKKCRVAGANAQ